MILLTEEELAQPVGDKFISVGAMYEANVYGRGLIQPLLQKLIDENPEFDISFSRNSPAEPEGFHIRWYKKSLINGTSSTLPSTDHFQ